MDTVVSGKGKGLAALLVLTERSTREELIFKIKSKSQKDVIKELNKLEAKIKEKGLTIIPTRLYLNDKGYAKIELALAKGKAEYDKRESLKKNDAKREMDRMMKH